MLPLRIFLFKKNLDQGLRSKLTKLDQQMTELVTRTHSISFVATLPFDFVLDKSSNLTAKHGPSKIIGTIAIPKSVIRKRFIRIFIRTPTIYIRLLLVSFVISTFKRYYIIIYPQYISSTFFILPASPPACVHT